MKYTHVAIDIETTGLDPYVHQIIEVAAVPLFLNEDGTPGNSHDVTQEYLGKEVAHRAYDDALDAARLLGVWGCK